MAHNWDTYWTIILLIPLEHPSIMDTQMIRMRIAELRRKRDMTARELARATGISKSTILRIEQNEVDPKLSLLLKIATVLDVPITELYNKEA